ncbi:hypothetical protein M438DRAFT_111732 [Aureobasidium pullulans EXF-150]|uniref:Uncharacterized protein n=1 Tax=Aureobasidium pullulans EXF-150 TaxID=1043002 RepID=A0A074X9K6_AURPU|nr:uncharacterized protein M438DRAFT_111732 [Aureobasidium pullulans EXF-150]KEQ80419.1 hypothetical protein M438DRAFT_111732 [Aureobasidium pullulans EXF-150]
MMNHKIINDQIFISGFCHCLFVLLFALFLSSDQAYHQLMIIPSKSNQPCLPALFLHKSPLIYSIHIHSSSDSLNSQEGFVYKNSHIR